MSGKGHVRSHGSMERQATESMLDYKDVAYLEILRVFEAFQSPGEQRKTLFYVRKVNFYFTPFGTN